MKRLVVTVVAVCAAWAAAPAGAFIYWTTYGGSVGRANLDGTGANQNFITGGSFTYGVAVDGTHIYWANQGLDTIARANLDGSGAVPNLISCSCYLTGIAVGGGYVYFADQLNGAIRIGRAPADGSGAAETVVALPNTARPDGVALDGSFVYWADNAAGTIQSHALAPSATAPLTLVSTLSNPNGVAVNATSLFYADYSDLVIGKSPLGGGTGVPIVNLVGHPSDVAIDAGHIYWSNNSGNTIGRANLDGTGAVENFVPSATSPSGVAVDAGALPPATAISLPPAAPNGANSWYVSAVHATVASSDNVYPVAQIRCVVDPASPPASFAALPASCPLVGAGADVSADGIHAVYAAAVDSQGNAGVPVAASFRIDRTGPAVSCIGNPKFELGSTGGAVTANVTDALSGPAAATVSAAPNAGSAGAKSVTVTGHDNAGNAGNALCSYIVRAPDLKPNPSMTWFFGATRKSSTVKILSLTKAPTAAKVRIFCSGHGCPFSSKRVKTKISKTKSGRTASADMRGLFRGRKLAVGAKVTVEVSQANRTGKAWVLTVRAGKQPSSNITCLALGSTVPGRGC